MNAPLSNRITSIDLLRGIIMMLMALDHVRDYFHNDAMMHDPLDLQTTTPILFFTRWITHYCAPIFVFLAGTSAYLSGLKKSKKELSRFLITRGLWLIFIEFAVVTFGWTFNPFYNMLAVQVIWAIGMSMLILGLLVWLPFPVILGVGLFIVFGHNMLDGPEAVRNGDVGFWWDLLHHGGFKQYEYTSGHAVLVIYPFVPWAGVMAAGYCFGKLFEPSVDAAWRKKVLLYGGLGLIAFFVLLRFSNAYGDPNTWSSQRSLGYTVLSFINTCKYPPSLLYLSMTIGPALIFLALTESTQNRSASVATVFGRVPFFYYILHLYVIHLLVVVAFYLSGYTSADIVSDAPFLFRPPQFGFSLWAVYAIWILVLIILYPICSRYNTYKSTHKSWWLSYL
jgi:uncharacterized membrane protein